jgi:hypothetical protein
MDFVIQYVKIEECHAGAKTNFQNSLTAFALGQTHFDPPPVHSAYNGPVIEPERVISVHAGVLQVWQKSQFRQIVGLYHLLSGFMKIFRAI